MTTSPVGHSTSAFLHWVRTLGSHRAFAPLAIGGLGALISAIGTGVPSLWFDEAATVSGATRSLPQLWTMLGEIDAVHGLYYLLIHGVFGVLGYTPTTLRLPSAVAVGIAAALVVVLGRLLTTERLAIIAGLVFCILPRVTWMGAEGRSAAATAAFAVGMTVLFVWALRAQRPGIWIAYGVLCWLGCALSVYLALAVVAHGVAILWLRRPLRGWAIAAGSAGFAGLPLVAAVISQSDQLFWVTPIGPRTVTDLLVAQWYEASWGWAILGGGLAILGAIAIARRGRDASAILLTAVLVPTTLLLIASILVTPLYHPRYLAMGTPFVAMLIAAGIDRVRWRPFPVIALAVLLALAVPEIALQRGPNAKDNTAWAEVAERIHAENDPSSRTAVVYGALSRGADARLISISYPDAFEGLSDVALLESAADAGQLWATAAPLAERVTQLDDYDTAYLITSAAPADFETEVAVLQSVGWVAVETWQLSDTRVQRWKRG